HQPDHEWQLTDPFHAVALRGEPALVYALKGPDGASVYEIGCHGGGKLLTVRRYQQRPQGQKPLFAEKTFELTAPLAGTPALENASVLLPLADGTLQRLLLDGGPRSGGPDWRSGRADEGARGHVVALGDDEFLTTNGSRGLTHWKWPQRGLFKTVPEKKVPT